jgi:Lon protease-like protein
VGFRLAELLPFDTRTRQSLLELDCASERLQQILAALPQFQGEG